MSAIEIVPVTTITDLKRFVRFQFDLYRGNPHWIPPLLGEELKTLRHDVNPAFAHCEAAYWLARRNKTVIGRIAGIINHRANAQWGARQARFGWVDFIDAPKVSAALFATVEAWARDKGMEAVHGPLGFTDFDPEGMLVDGFGELGTAPDIYNHPYYPRHLPGLGYAKDADWFEYQMAVPDRVPEKAQRLNERILKRYRLRVVRATRRRDLTPYIGGFFEVLDATYRHVYGYVPLTPAQTAFYTERYFAHLVPDYVRVIVDEADRVAAFVIGFPSLSRALQRIRGKLYPFGFLTLLQALRHNPHVEICLGAVRPDLQGKGLTAILMDEITRVCIRNRIVSVEASKQLESNVLIRAHWRYYDSRQHKRRRCFRKEL
jgi:GNAT superfamily N-acetyltransferase